MSNALETKTVNGRPVEACKNCIYFRRAPVDPKNLGAKPQGGFCKEGPPTPVIVVGQGPGGQVLQQLVAYFPPVPDDEICGHYDDGIAEDDEAAD